MKRTMSETVAIDRTNEEEMCSETAMKTDLDLVQTIRASAYGARRKLGPDAPGRGHLVR